MIPELPLYIEDLDCWVHLEPGCDYPGETRYDYDGTPHIVLKEYDERVLLHECIHATFAREREARESLGPREERIVRWLTQRLYGMGWRLHETDRSLAQIERELNRTAAQRDELARQIDGSDKSRAWPLHAAASSLVTPGESECVRDGTAEIVSTFDDRYRMVTEEAPR